MAIKKFFLSIAVISAFAFYIVYEKGWFHEFNDEAAGRVIPPALAQNPPSPAPSPLATPEPAATTPSPVPAPAPAPAPVIRGQYRNGIFTGSVADAYYGYVQVRATVKSGRISDVQFLQYPNDRSTSREINSQAVPYLTAEAIQAQNANVDIVSGATQTSLAFRESLGSALTQAQ